jgi:hypothetical protein
MQQPWWKRAGTFQEFLLANDAVFLYVGGAVSWQILTVVLQSAYDAIELIEAEEREDYFWPPNKTFDGELETSMAAVRFILDYKASLTGSGDLLKLLSHSRNCGASDMRDHVYAFLGVANPN